MSRRQQEHAKPLDMTVFFCAQRLIVLALTSKSQHKIVPAMSTLSLLF